MVHFIFYIYILKILNIAFFLFFHNSFFLTIYKVYKNFFYNDILNTLFHIIIYPKIGHFHSGEHKISP